MIDRWDHSAGNADDCSCFGREQKERFETEIRFLQISRTKEGTVNNPSWEQRDNSRETKWPIQTIQ